MKKFYNAPEAKEVVIESQDVITASLIKDTASSGAGITATWEQG